MGFPFKITNKENLIFNSIPFFFQVISAFISSNVIEKCM